MVVRGVVVVGVVVLGMVVGGVEVLDALMGDMKNLRFNTDMINFFKNIPRVGTSLDKGVTLSVSPPSQFLLPSLSLPLSLSLSQMLSVCLSLTVSLKVPFS